MKPVRQQSFDSHELADMRAEFEEGSTAVRVLELSDAEALEVCKHSKPPIRPFWPVPATHWEIDTALNADKRSGAYASTRDNWAIQQELRGQP